MNGSRDGCNGHSVGLLSEELSTESKLVAGEGLCGSSSRVFRGVGGRVAALIWKHLAGAPVVLAAWVISAGVTNQRCSLLGGLCSVVVLDVCFGPGGFFVESEQ